MPDLLKAVETHLSIWDNSGLSADQVAASLVALRYESQIEQLLNRSSIAPDLLYRTAIDQCMFYRSHARGEAGARAEAIAGAWARQKALRGW